MTTQTTAGEFTEEDTKKVLRKVIQEHPVEYRQLIENYMRNRSKMINFIMGQTMKKNLNFHIETTRRLIAERLDAYWSEP